MKNYWKYTFALLLAAGAAALAGCDDDEELNLPGYPETPVGIVIADSENAPTVTVKGTYEEGTGELKLDGALSRTYIFALSTPSPEDATFHVEKIATNIPEDRVSISATELTVPAGAISAEVEVALTDEDTAFMADERGAMNYEIGVRLTAVEGSRVTMPQTEAKVIVEKEAYVMHASVVGTDGSRSAQFKRSCIDGEIINEDAIAYEFKVRLDKPALRDLTFKAVSTGTPEDYKTCESFSGDLTIAAGELESAPAAWSLTDDFLEGNDDPASYEIVLAVSAADGADDVAMDEEQGLCTITVEKTCDLMYFGSSLDPGWTKFNSSTWTTVPSNASNLLDTSVYTYFGSPQAVIDMKEKKEIAGFRTVDYYGWGYYYPTSYTISISDDNEAWTSIGELQSADAPTNDAHYIGLYKPVEARYIKLNMSGGWFYLATFEVYGKN